MIPIGNFIYIRMGLFHYLLTVTAHSSSLLRVAMDAKTSSLPSSGYLFFFLQSILLHFHIFLHFFSISSILLSFPNFSPPNLLLGFLHIGHFFCFLPNNSFQFSSPFMSSPHFYNAPVIIINISCSHFEWYIDISCR